MHHMESKVATGMDSSSSIVIDVIPADGILMRKQVEKRKVFGERLEEFMEEMSRRKYKMRKTIHSVKVGVALVFVSLLYLLNPLYHQVGQNAIWAIMTVVVTFEFTAGATLSKGINRGIGTIIGGGLGCLAAASAQRLGNGGTVLIGISIFVIGAGATYGRQWERIKRRYDYGAMIFILTFNMLVVSGLHGGDMMEQARQRLATVALGFAICILVSLLVFPIWAGDELHISLANRFQLLAKAIQGCLEEYCCLESPSEGGSQQLEMMSSSTVDECKSTLHSKARDEQLVNFARWEPWHGRFGCSYPWQNYIQIGDILRDIAATISFLTPITLPSTQMGVGGDTSSIKVGEAIEEVCERVGSSVAWTLRELGDNFVKMRRCDNYEVTILPELKSIRLQLNSLMLPSTLHHLQHHRATLLWSLAEMVDKLETLAKEMDHLAQLANFTR